MLTEITHDDNKVTWFTTESLTTLYKYSCGDYFVKNPGVAIVILFFGRVQFTFEGLILQKLAKQV